MKTQFDHPAIAWLGADPFSLPVYRDCFEQAAVKIMGESPYLNAKSAGISFGLTKAPLRASARSLQLGARKVKAVFLYSEGYEGFAEYDGELPAKLSLSSSRAKVRKALGEPAMSGDKGGVGLMAIDASFDRFEDGGHYLRFQYLPGDKSIQLVTIGSCDD